MYCRLLEVERLRLLYFPTKHRLAFHGRRNGLTGSPGCSTTPRDALRVVIPMSNNE